MIYKVGLKGYGGINYMGLFQKPYFFNILRNGMQKHVKWNNIQINIV